jgi:hypothetical protein
MSHFAELDENNVVIRVIVGDNNKPNEGLDWIQSRLGGRWVQTSYNGSFRVRFAGEGYTYDQERDAFIEPKPFDSWVLNEETLTWQPPIPFPEGDQLYTWDENSQNWLITAGE